MRKSSGNGDNVYRKLLLQEGSTCGCYYQPPLPSSAKETFSLTRPDDRGKNTKIFLSKNHYVSSSLANSWNNEVPLNIPLTIYFLYRVSVTLRSATKPNNYNVVLDDDFSVSEHQRQSNYCNKNLPRTNKHPFKATQLITQQPYKVSADSIRGSILTKPPWHSPEGYKWKPVLCFSLHYESHSRLCVCVCVGEHKTTLLTPNKHIPTEVQATEQLPVTQCLVDTDQADNIYFII